MSRWPATELATPERGWRRPGRDPVSVTAVNSPIRIGLLGCGNVGGALVELVAADAERIEERTGVRIELAAVAVRSAAKDRGVALDPALVTTDAAAVVERDDIDIVVELIGGIEPARQLVTSALRSGKSVVTGNKELLANYGHELWELAEECRRDLLFESAVGGGIPVVRALRESLIGEEVGRVIGIVNGTTNFILSAMSDSGKAYAAALSEAQTLGYAERDPTADVEGFDAGAKAAILASIAFGTKVVAGDVYHEGIASISQDDIGFAARMGYDIKLLAICERSPDGVSVRVHPAMVPRTHPLAGVRGSYNALFVEGAAAGDLMFYGAGAGGRPSASAVLGDIIEAAANRIAGAHSSLGSFRASKVVPIDGTSSPFYVHLEVADQPGVLAAVAEVFGRHGVSIRSMEQVAIADRSGERRARLVFITHSASESAVQQTLRDLRRLSVGCEVTSTIRVVADEAED